MFKLNSFCKECFDPYKIVWNCKKHTDDKEWIYLCYNCIRDVRSVRIRFISQIENIKRIIRCRLNPSKIYLQLFEVEI